MKKKRQHHIGMRLLLLSLLLAITGSSAWGEEYTIIPDDDTEIPIWEENVYVKPGKDITLFVWEMKQHGEDNPPYRWYRRWYLDTRSTGTIAKIDNTQPGLEKAIDDSFFWHHKLHLSDGATESPNDANGQEAERAAQIKYTMPQHADESFVATVICDISINDDGSLDKTNHTLKEPTLSKRYKFIIRPASVIAKQIKDGPEKYTIETPSGTKHVNLQMALSSENYYWYGDDNTLQSSPEGKLYYQVGETGKRTVGKDGDTDITNSPLISIDFLSGLTEETTVYVYGDETTDTKLAEFTLIPQKKAGFEFEETLKDHEETYAYRMPISHPELFEEIGYYDFDLDEVSNNLTNNNAGPYPMDPSITSYAFVYPLKTSISDKVVPYQNQYGLYRTAMLENVSDTNTEVTMSDGTTKKTYKWYLPDDADAIFDRTYMNSPTNDKKYGYFYYIDASLEAGRIVNVPITGYICGGTELVVTAWINNMTSSVDITVPNINMYLVGENTDLDGNVTESEILHRFSSGNSIAELGKWQQLYYRVTLPFDAVSKYSSYRLEVVNNALNSNGNDFAIDDVRIFRTVPRAEARQGNSLCDEEVSEISISMDYEKLLTMLGLHENDKVPTDLQPSKDVWDKVEKLESVADKTTYRKVQYWVYSISDKWKTAPDLTSVYMIDGDETSGKLIEQELYISDQAEGGEATYRLNYDVLDRIQEIRIDKETSQIFEDCFKAANLFYDVKEDEQSDSGTAIISTVTTNMHNEGYTTDPLAAYTDEGTVIFQNVGFPDKGGAESDFYIIYIPTEANVESGFQNLNDRCSMVTPFKLKKAEDIVTVVDEENTDTEMDIDDIEGGNTYKLTGHFSARTSIDAAPEEVEKATFDWFFGSRTDFENPARGIEYNGKKISIQEALEEYHASVIPPHSPDILTALQNRFGKENVKEWKDEDDPTSTTLNASEVKLILHAKEIMITTEEGLNNMPLVVTPNPSTYEDLTGDEGDGLLYCVAPREMWLGGKTQIVPGDPDIPKLADYWYVRLGMGQIKDMIGDENEGSATRLRIPIYDITPANNTTRDFQIIEGNTGIQVVDTNDEAYQESSETENPEGPSDEAEGQNIVANITKLGIPETGEMAWDNAFVEIQFNNKNAMKFREGFEYTLRIPFGEEITIDSSDEENTKLLEGTFDLRLKIVPEYVVWTGSKDGERNWNNDGHWERATKDDLHDKDDSRAEKYPGKKQAYAPMYFTNVIIQNGDGGAYSAYPYLYKLEDKDEETEGLLNMDVPEDMENVIGDATDNIEYDLMVDPRYEKVYGEENDIDAYTCVRFYGNRCDSIHFKPETELLHAEYLAYEHASIDYELDPNRWYTLASPLQAVVAGDMYLPTGANDIPYARQETPLFEGITFSTDNYSRWNPAVYMRGWDKSGEGTVVTPEGNGIVYALEGSWSNLYNKVDERFTPGTGFSIGVDANMIDEKVMFRLPKADTEYDYYAQGDEDPGNTVENISRTNAGKLIDIASITLPDATEVDGHRLIGNPFMAHLDMKKLLEENSTYYILGEDGTVSNILGEDYIITTGDSNDDPTKIAPLQSFLTNKANITFTNDMQTTATEGKPTLRAATKSLPEIRLTAERDGKRGTTVVAYLPSASENYLQGEDAMLLADKEQNAPQIYTLSANNRMLAINLTEKVEDIPIGIYGTNESPVMLRIQTSGEFADAVLYDQELKKSYPLQEGVTLNVPGNTSGRYFLRAGTPTANETIATGDIQIYSLSGNRVMVTATTPLKDIRVYDMGGAVVKHVKAGVCSFELYLANGIYVITAENAEGETETAKVVVR